MNEPRPTIYLLDHAQEGLASLGPVLERQGYRVVLRRNVGESLAHLPDGPPPDLVLLAPLVLDPKGVEIQILTTLTRGGAVPVLLAVEHLDRLERAADLPITLRDFVTLPLEPKEVILRIGAGLQVRREIQTLQQRAEELSNQVIRDFKTGLFNARHFALELRREFQRVLRSQRPMALLMLDIDDFKGINDTTEYAFGDRVLAEVARTLKANIREIDLAARFGGDEFVVLLPGTTPAEAIQVASRIRNTLNRLEIREGRYSCRLSASIGVDCFNGQAPGTPEELKSRANRALQEAKRRGKNCIWLYSEPYAEPQEGSPAPEA